MSTLAVEGLRVRLPTPAGDVTVVDGVDYEVQPAEVFGIAGESGSGKTVSMLALLGLLPEGSSVEGSARFAGDDLIHMPRRRLRSISGRDIAMVFQDPFTSLHPMLSVGKQVTEHVRLHLGLDRRAADERAVELLADVRIPDPPAALRRFPHQFSGGMRQRIAIAIALACRPRLLIADEPDDATAVDREAGTGDGAHAPAPAVVVDDDVGELQRAHGANGSTGHASRRSPTRTSGGTSVRQVSTA